MAVVKNLYDSICINSNLSIWFSSNRFIVFLINVSFSIILLWIAHYYVYYNIISYYNVIVMLYCKSSSVKYVHVYIITNMQDIV
jgi:hypothetical protein